MHTLIDSLTTTTDLAAMFSDRSLLQALIDVELALARVQARLGVIPAAAAEAIAGAAHAAEFDAAAIARDARSSGTIVIPFVRALTERVAARDDQSARFVHWGATSQDIADTAMVLLLAQARPVLVADQSRLAEGLRALSDRHAASVMLGRTLLQPAPPITFGLKAAEWYGGVVRNGARLSRAFDDALVVQCGGASGTLASLGSQGLAVSRLLAAELQLRHPESPWHAHRDRLAALVATFGVSVSTLGKIARDISLLMQPEIGEAGEPGGDSSAMPQKQNPSGCAIVLAAATRLPGLVSTFLAGAVQEHERSVGGWHAEWPTVSGATQSTGAALAAHRVLADAARQSRESGRSLTDVLMTVPEVTALLSPDAIRTLDVPEQYLGEAETIRRQILADAPSAQET